MLVALLGLTILVIHFGTDINVRYIVSDPSETALLPEYTGAYSHLGVLVLWTAAVTSILTGAVIRGHPKEERLSSFFVQLGVLTGWLAADDLFMWHEFMGLAMARAIGADDIATRRSQLEGIVVLIYGLLWIWWILRYWPVIRNTDYLLLLLTLGSLAASGLVDIGTYVILALRPRDLWAETTVAVGEEMFKLLGMFFVLVYVIRTAFPVIRRFAEPPAPA